MITSRYNLGMAAEVDAIGAAAEVDAIRAGAEVDITG